MTWVRWIFAVIVIGLVGMVAMNSLRPRPEPPTSVEVAEVQKTSITRTVSGAGKLEPLTKVNVSSNITGVLMDLQVGIGSEVKKGQYLGQIDTARYKSQVDQSKAQASAAGASVTRERVEVERLTRELERVEKLVDQNAAGSQELEGARSALRSAQAQLQTTLSQSDMAKAGLREVSNNLSWATLKAPVDGTVLAVNHRVGERIRGSDFTEDVVLVLGSLAKMDVRIEVGEHDVVHIHPGQKATIEIDALPDVVVEGTVIDSGRDAIIKNAGTDNEVTTYPVWVSLDNPPPSALSGMSAQVTISTETRDGAVAVPIQSVTVRMPDPDPKAQPGTPPAPGTKLEKVVFVVKDGKVGKRAVATGISSDTMVEITKGLEPGEKVVGGPYRVLARDLKDGMTVVEEEQDKGPGNGQGNGPPK